MKFFLKEKFFFIEAYLILIILSSLSYSQPSNSNIKFVRYSTSMGLSSNSQRCITQDKEGFIWIGTADGLNRFDGYSFKVYRKNPNDTTSLKSNIINSLFTDSKGNLWIGTYSGGLSRYNKEKDNFVNYPDLINENINTVVEDKYHRLWVGTTMGLYMIDPRSNKSTRFFANVNNPLDPATIANNEVDRIVPDNNILWIAYSTGVFSALNITDLKFKHYVLFYVSGHETADFSVNSIILDNDNIWISTWSKGIWIFNKTTGGCRPYENEKSQYINFIFKDSKNRFWYSPEYKGLVLVEGNQQINFKEDDFNRNGISSNLLSNIFQDKQGNLWLTSKLGDLNYVVLENRFYNWYKNPNSKYELSSNLINTVMEDSKRRIWIGYEEGGIDLLDANNNKPKIHINGDNATKLGPGPILDIFESRHGEIWITKYLDGLKKFNESTKSFISYQHINGNEASIAGNDVRHISEDSRGNLWLSIHGGGVDMFNPKTEKVTHYKRDINNPAASILSDWTFTALCDKQDNIWVASVNGVSVISEKNGVIKQYTRNNKKGYNLSADISYIVFEDSKNFIWIGTSDGLNKLDPKTGMIKKYYTKDGLPGNLIIDILEDNSNNIWISTTNGLSRFSPRDETFKNFSVRDGLATDEFNKFASYKNRLNEMYFGGRDGLTRFNPDSIKVNNFKPPVYITDFKLFNQSVQVNKDNPSKWFTIPKQIMYCNEITLDHDQNEITLEFAALNYLNLEKNLYKYRLEGFDNHWSMPGNKREVTYTNLDPGEYTFRVIASNNDGIWNTDGASLKIIVKPPFWKTNWAYAFYFLFILFLLYLFRKFILHEAGIKRKLELEELEIQKLHEMDLLKMQFFANVSHEFRTPLTLIIGPIENLLRDIKDEFKQVQLKIINRNANRLLRLINQLMDFRKIEEARLELNPTKNDIILFIREIVDTFKQDAVQHNINFEFKHTCPSLEIWFDTDKLDKITYNFLSNAFKFTRDGGRIEISVELNCALNTGGIPGQKSKYLPTDKVLKIIIKDTGIGIPKDLHSKIFDRFYQVKNTLNKQGTGIGLSLTFELVKLHSGEIIVESTPGVGSEFTVVLPLWLDENELPHPAQLHEKTSLPIPDNGQKTPLDENSEQVEFKEEYTFQKDNLPKILIVEDNADMRLFIKNDFKKSYNVLEAHDGIMGLQKAFEEMPDAIICDVMMPGKDGLEVCRTLKNDERTSHIPVVMLTARSSEQHTIEGLESGADDYVSKPFSSAVLKVRIKNLIESRILLRKKFTSEPFAALTEIAPSKTDEMLFKKAYSIVEKNLNNPNFEVNDFAFEIGMSRTQLYRKINAISGQSVKEFIRIIRLKKAAELLTAQENNISEVAFSVGFNSVSYFTTSFTEYYGINPSKYVEKFVKY